MRIACSAMLLAALLSSCTTLQRAWVDGMHAGGVIGLVPTLDIEREAHWVLPRDTRFYVAVAQTTELPPSSAGELLMANPPDAAQLGAWLAFEISRHFPLVEQAAGPESLLVARQSALAHEADYVIYPRMLHWAGSAGEWDVVADAVRFQSRGPYLDDAHLERATLQLTVMEVGSGRIMDMVNIDTRGGVLTMAEKGPEGLLTAALGRYVDSLVP